MLKVSHVGSYWPFDDVDCIEVYDILMRSKCIGWKLCLLPEQDREAVRKIEARRKNLF